MQIVFVHLGIEFDGDALKRGPLGGTETALIGVSSQLSKHDGVDVHIFTNTKEEKIFDGVTYHPVSKLWTWGQSNNIDVLISIRQWLPFWLPLEARFKIYFSPDSYDQPFLHHAMQFEINVHGKPEPVSLFEPRMFFDQINAIFCVGRWQAEQFVKRLGFPENKMVVTANGIFPENFDPQPLDRRNRRLMYSSTPFRGLEHLVAYYPELKKDFPDLGLEVCSGMAVYGVSQVDDQNSYGALYQKLIELGAISHGSVSQKELAKIMCHNLIYTYPNTFEETFCISVLEAQAAGLPVVTSKKGALVERITNGVDGFLVEGEPYEERYQKEFIAITRSLLENKDLWNQISTNALKRAATQTYEKLAADWLTVFESVANVSVPLSKGYIPELDSYIFDSKSQPGKKIKLERQTVQVLLYQALANFGYQR